jgi:type II secretory pathway component PulF
VNQDEIAFTNQQLAAMLRAGIPLEPALRQLCAEMRRGRWQRELDALRVRLESGSPLPEALEQGGLPLLYRRMLAAGAKAGDLPAVLNQLADHYRESALLRMRVRSAAVYPLVTLFAATLLSLVLLAFWNALRSVLLDTLNTAMWMGNAASPGQWLLRILFWSPSILLVLAALTTLAFLSIRPLRQWAAWKFPVFKEASLAQAASAVGLALRRGTPLPQALALAESLSPGTPAAVEWRRWQTLLEQGRGKPEEFAAAQRSFPRVFGWLLAGSGESLAEGFTQAASVFAERAKAHSDLMVQGLTPVLVVLTGVALGCQAFAILRSLVVFMDMLGQ